jgi:hypothetical protein
VMADVSGMGTVMIVTAAWDGYHLCADTVSRVRTRERELLLKGGPVKKSFF